jgi:hypothetical protein
MKKLDLDKLRDSYLYSMGYVKYEKKSMKKFYKVFKGRKLS